ncbi:hypothetical protein Tco_0457756 [Tanacetum coccineum]
MTTLKFADTHNMVAFLAKPAESEGFEQIVDFLNAHTIKYALTVNPTIYTSCIEQFWATVKAKTVNGEVQLQALVDGKKIIITESIIRRDLQLEDAEGVDCLPNATIFEQLTLMGYEKISQKLTFYKAFFSPQWKFLIHTILQCLSSKTTAWNEFSSTMASAMICLATNQKFNFSKFIFESMVKNLDNVFGIFLMYPRFVQVFVNQQLEGMPTHKRIYIAPSHTKKIFGNMRRVRKGFSGRETPLFQIMMVQDQEEVGEGSEMPTDPHHTPTIIQPSTSQPQKKQRSRRSKRKDTEVPQPSGPITNVADVAVNKEMDDSLVRAATTPTSLDAKQDRGSVPKCQETMGDTIAQTRFENVSKHSNDPLLTRGNTLRSGEDRLKLKELMELCTNLQIRVLDLETTKTTQANEIASLKRRVKKLERRNKSRTHGLKRLYKVGSSRRVESSEDEGLGEEDASKQGRIADIDANEDIYLVNVQTDEDMFGVNDLDGDEVIVESVDVVNTAEETRSVVEEVTAVTIPVSAATTTTTTTAITDVEITLAQALAELKSAKPKADKVVIQEPEQGTTTTTPTLTTTTAATTIIADSTRPKAKGIVFHEQEQAPTPTVSSQQPSQVKVQDKGKGKMVEPEPVKKLSKKDLLRLDEELAFKRQAKEEEEKEERIAREKAQQVKEANIAWDHVQAKIEADYQLAQRLQAQEQAELTDEEKARLFAEAKIAHESSLKRTGEELEQKSSKKQKLEEVKESKELKKCLEIVLNDGDDVTIHATPLSTKSPTIVDYKIYKEGKKSYFQIIRADDNSQMYLTFGKMLKNFDREDLEVLWSIVKARFKKTKLVNYMDNFLLLNLKTMFEHHVEDNVWKNQQGLVKVLNWNFMILVEFIV